MGLERASRVECTHSAGDLGRSGSGRRCTAAAAPLSASQRRATLLAEFSAICEGLPVVERCRMEAACESVTLEVACAKLLAARYIRSIRPRIHIGWVQMLQSRPGRDGYISLPTAVFRRGSELHAPARASAP